MKDSDFERFKSPEESLQALPPIFAGYGLVATMAGLNPMVGIPAAMMAAIKIASAASSLENINSSERI